jgi:peptidyl-prolyl cis-trans isomerase C
MTKTIHPPALALVLAVAAIPAAATAAEAAGSKVLATVNGAPITEDVYEMYVKHRQARAGDAEVDRDTVISELVNIELVRQDALKRGIDKRPEIARQIDWQTRSLLVSAGMKDYLRNHPVSEEELQKAYEAEIAKLDSRRTHGHTGR